jgi:hypothetical protein
MVKLTILVIKLVRSNSSVGINVLVDVVNLAIPLLAARNVLIDVLT